MKIIYLGRENFNLIFFEQPSLSFWFMYVNDHDTFIIS